MITTNNHWRQWLTRDDIPESVLNDDFDWLDPDTFDGFICYRGSWSHMSEYMRFGYPGPLGQTWEGWHGYCSDSFSSGTLIRLPDDRDWEHEGMYQIGTYILTSEDS
jgi:hypothetical protein